MLTLEVVKGVIAPFIEEIDRTRPTSVDKLMIVKLTAIDMYIKSVMFLKFYVTALGRDLDDRVDITADDYDEISMYKESLECILENELKLAQPIVGSESEFDSLYSEFIDKLNEQYIIK